MYDKDWEMKLKDQELEEKDQEIIVLKQEIKVINLIKFKKFKKNHHLHKEYL